MPQIIRAKPSTFPRVMGSWKKSALRKRTATKARLMKGYAKEISNFVITAIQKRLAMKAAAKPERTNGSRKALVKNNSLPVKSSGRAPFMDKRHFKISWPYTVKKIQPKMQR